MNAIARVSLTASCLLAACSNLHVTDPTSRYYDLPATSIVVVQQGIAIPPETSRAILQGARVVSFDKLRRYEPFCEIEVNNVFDTEQWVRPGRFTVTRVERQQLGAASRPVLLAGSTLMQDGGAVRLSGVFGRGIGASTRVGLLDNDSDTLVLNTVRLRLASAEQPNVRELRCAGGWDRMSNAVYPTLAEMRSALGPLVSIEIP